MARIDDLRAEAKRRERAAAAKVRRNMDKGIILKNSVHDPLAAKKKNVSQMRTRELESYLGKLNNFTSRKIQFVAGVFGEPLRADKVREYRRLEAERNARGAKHVEQFRDVFIPSAGMTVAQRAATQAASNRDIIRAGGNPQFRPYDEHNRDIQGIPSQAALDKLIQHERAGNMPGKIRNALIVQRKHHKAFLENRGVPELSDAVGALSIKQFDLLKNHTNYINTIEFVYLGQEEGGSSWAAKIREDKLGDAADMIEWASKQ